MSHDIQQHVPLTDSIDAPVDISQLDLPLKVEIDTISLPVAQLSALRTGYVLELPTPLATARIRLVTYGQTVGFGELVSVGDHLGVRVVQLPQSYDHGSI
jgi:type III secretion protein Q